MERKDKVVFYKPFFEFIFKHSRFFLVMFIIVVSTYLFFNNIPFIMIILEKIDANLNITAKNLTVAIVSSVFIAIGSFLWLVIKNWKQTTIIFKRKIYIKLFNYSLDSRNHKVAKCIVNTVIRTFYNHNRVILDKQQEASTGILDGLSSSSFSHFNRIWWIEGSPFSGKTTTVLNLLIDLISKEVYVNLFKKLDGKIFYIDMSREDFHSRTFIENYTRGAYENGLLIFDNMHKSSDKECLLLLTSIILDIRAFAIIAILRKAEDFLSDSELANKIKNIISSHGVKYELPTINQKQFIPVKKDFEEFCKRYGINYSYRQNDSVTIHLAILYTKYTDKDNKYMIESLINFYNGQSLNVIFNKVISSIIAFSIFTGSFSINLLQELNKDILPNKINEIIKNLSNISFIIEYPDLEYKYYHIHENIAKYYFNNAFRTNQYMKYFNMYFEKLAEHYIEKDNKIFAFLYYFINGESYLITKPLFLSIVSNINYNNLFYELNFILKNRPDLLSHHLLEMGILCDRLGRLKDAKEYFNSCLNSFDANDAYYRLVQIDHTAYKKYEIIRTKLVDDLYYKFLDKYWMFHLEMHIGKFDFKGYEILMKDCELNYDEIVNKNEYDGPHFLRRLYFDYFRCYYLSGNFNLDFLKSIMSPSNLLKRKLKVFDEFEAYYIKFAIGSLLQYDILFEKVFINKYLTKKDFDLLFNENDYVDLEKLYEAHDIIEEAIKAFNMSLTLLEKFGDKTAIFVKCHIFELEMMKENYDVAERFFTEYMQFANNEQDSEYQSYAQTYTLKLYLLKFLDQRIIAEYSEYQYDMLKKRITDIIRNIHLYLESLSKENDNRYARLRIKLYETIYNYISGNIDAELFKSSIKSSLTFTKKNGYGREYIIFNQIATRNYSINSMEARTIFLYYPIVTQ